jgi:hypothetical protein
VSFFLAVAGFAEVVSSMSALFLSEQFHRSRWHRRISDSSPVGSGYYRNRSRAIRTQRGDPPTNDLPTEPVRW